MDQARPKIIAVYEEGVTIATLTDDRILEEPDIQLLESSIRPLIKSATDLVLDFSNVVFLSSAVLGLLIRVSKKIYESQGRLRLCSISPKILEIFKITRLDKVFEICEDQTEAIQSLA